MDLAAVKDAPALVLARGSAAAARNACGLVEDAELLSVSGRIARAYSLAGLAVEEVGKAGSLATLAAMPENLRARAPLGRMLEWHQMKLVTGQLIAAVPFRAPGVPAKFVTTPLSELTGILDNARACAEDVDRLKQRGLYVDVDRSGRVREPSEAAADELSKQLDLARRAACATNALLDPSAPQWLANPGADAVEFSRALVSTCCEMGLGLVRSPEAAADVLLNTATKILG
jgi:AbiV family abortive infection protein